MNVPVHFDLTDVEKTMREDHARFNKKVLESAPDETSRELVAMQNDLRELQIHATLWHMGCINRSAPEELAENALGYTLGSIVASFCQNSDDPHASMENVMRALAVALFEEDGDEDVVREHRNFQAAQGGQA